MILLATYVAIAIGISFLCSIAEAVLLSVTNAHISTLVKAGKPSGQLLEQLKSDVSSPLAAILTLNTIAHTIGAAGAGAQATVVFGDAWLGLFSAVLTLLILLLSEIIPKTLGARYWKQLAPATAVVLKYLIKLLYPFVLLSQKLTGGMHEGPTLRGFNRSEFAAMAAISAEEGLLAEHESHIMQNMLALRKMAVTDAMTPRIVVFSLPQATTVAEFMQAHESTPFSRIPLYVANRDEVCGFVLKTDLLLAFAKGQGECQLAAYQRDLPSLPNSTKLSVAFNEFIRDRVHMRLIVNEYGESLGIITLEDVLETLLGLEIVDEKDTNIDMQQLARELWQQRAKKMGLDPLPGDAP